MRLNSQHQPESCYQLDLVTPVISPLEASLRKQSLQMPNFLI